MPTAGPSASTSHGHAVGPGRIGGKHYISSLIRPTLRHPVSLAWAAFAYDLRHSMPKIFRSVLLPYFALTQEGLSIGWASDGAPKLASGDPNRSRGPLRQPSYDYVRLHSAGAPPTGISPWSSKTRFEIGAGEPLLDLSKHSAQGVWRVAGLKPLSQFYQAGVSEGEALR
jgi:hypothetical protein